MNFITPGVNPKYSIGPDFTHGSVRTCMLRYSSMKAGLYFVQCNVCQSTLIINVNVNGTVQIACASANKDAMRQTAPP
jgi:hypothetical protein